jgi:pyruvate/2-oxoacid:ferredoxin oxidoreductase beta subunit
MNTGIQRSSSTPHGAWTTTTPVSNFKRGPKKNMVEIMAAHNIPYAATANIAFPEDFIVKLKKARNINGPKFIQVLSPCPVGWKFPSNITIKIAKLAYETCIYPLYEFENNRYTISKRPNMKKPVKEYLALQGRFRHLTEPVIEEIQKNVDREWDALLKKEGVLDANTLKL